MPRASTVKKVSPESWRFALDNIKLCALQANREYERTETWISAGYTPEDMLSIALMAVAKNADKYSDERGKASTFVYVCVRNRFNWYLKSFGTRKNKADVDAVALSLLTDDGDEVCLLGLSQYADAELTDELERIEKQIDLRLAIRSAELTRNEGEALYYTCVLGDTVKDAAAKMGMSPQNVSRIRAKAARKIHRTRGYSEVAI